MPQSFPEATSYMQSLDRMCLLIRINYSCLSAVGMASLAEAVVMSLVTEESLPWKPLEVREESWVWIVCSILRVRFLISETCSVPLCHPTNFGPCKAIWLVQPCVTLLGLNTVHFWKKRELAEWITVLSIYTFCFKTSKHLKKAGSSRSSTWLSLTNLFSTWQPVPSFSQTNLIPSLLYWFSILYRKNLQTFLIEPSKSEWFLSRYSQYTYFYFLHHIHVLLY